MLILHLLKIYNDMLMEIEWTGDWEFNWNGNGNQNHGNLYGESGWNKMA